MAMDARDDIAAPAIVGHRYGYFRGFKKRLLLDRVSKIRAHRGPSIILESRTPGEKPGGHRDAGAPAAPWTASHVRLHFTFPYLASACCHSATCARVPMTLNVTQELAMVYSPKAPSHMVQ